jgi:aspartate/methionine/tyrosine aminotransferase
MTRVRAAYMEWAKSRPTPAIDLAGSNLLACRLDDLPGALDAVDIAGEAPDGYPPLVDAIAERYGVSPEAVATAGGCSGANFLACAALLDAGDDVLVESPYYDPLPAAARMVGARVQTFDRRFEDGFDLDPDRVLAALTPRTRLIQLTSPHNPSGVLASRDHLVAVARLAETRGIHVLVDEVYRDVTASPRPPIGASLSPAVITTSSLTKAYGLASLRCGWAIASPPVAERIRRARDVVDVWGAIPADRLALVALRNLDRLAERAARIVRPNRRRIEEWLAGRNDLEFVLPAATLAFPRLRGIADSGPFCKRLYAETGTAVAPGHFFGAPAHFRIAFGTDPDTVAAGLAAISRCLDARPA